MPNSRRSSSQPLSDLSFPGMLHVATVRAGIARGELKALKAPSLPRGYRLVEAADIPGRNALPAPGEGIPILVSGRVSHRGQPVALVAGPDPVLCAELAAAVEPVYAEAEPEFSLEGFSSAQVLAKRIARAGEIDLAFSIAERTVEANLGLEVLEHDYSEPQGALALFDYDKLAVYAASQWPFHVRDAVAAVLGSAPAEISVRPCPLGFHLDGKLWYPSLLAAQAALAAFVCRAPCKLLLTREEDFLSSPKRARSSAGMRAAVDAAGNLSALDARIGLDVGAFAPFGAELLSQASMASLGPYRCPNFRIEGYAVRTDSLPLGAFAGLGSAHGQFFVETLGSRLAVSLGEDPMDWKLRNLAGKGESLLSGELLREAPPAEELCARLAEASGWRRKRASYELVRKRGGSPAEGPLRGIGFAFGWQGSEAFMSLPKAPPCSVEVELDKELRLYLRTSAALGLVGDGSGSGGLVELWKRSAADILGLSPESIVVEGGSTDSLPDSGPLTLSRGLVLVTRLVEKACEALQARRFREPLPLVERATARPSRAFRWDESGPRGKVFEGAAWCGAVVELELDPWTLQPRPLGIWLCVDAGRLLDPPRAASRLRAAALEALESSLASSVELEGGIPRREAYYERSGLPAGQTPPIGVEFLEAGRQARAKGIGELAAAAVPAACAAALSQALGQDVGVLPYAPEALEEDRP